jgi:hypothetical protein
MAISKISGNMIDGSLTSSLVTGSLPAVDGSALTGASAGIDTETTSDPLITTNPSATGHLWVNKNSGEMFVCTDKTAGANVWYNIGRGSGDVAPYSFQGTISGFTTGGQNNTAPGNSPASNIIDKFSFSSDGNATDHGDLVSPSHPNQGNTSETHGYVCGGRNAPTVGAISALIDRFAFATSGNSVNVGTLTQAREYAASQSSSTHGYNSAGVNGSTSYNIIDKFTFAASANATDVGDVTVGRFGAAGQSSSTHGYTSGAQPASNVIDKFSFSVDGNATDHGDLSVARGYSTGQSSTTHGYTSAAVTSNTNVIDKFAFGSNANATDVGDLTVGRAGPAGQSSTTHGYTSGGDTLSNVIDKFTFASNANATDVGDLTESRGYTSGHQF